MHEVKHETGENRPDRRLSFEEIIRNLGAEMREFALANPTLTLAENAERVQRGDFSKVLQIKDTVRLHIIMTISPAENEQDDPFWHCSMSLVSPRSGRAKTVNLWTRREMQNVKNLLPKFLGERGLKGTQGFMRTKTALHCYRNLTADELKTVGR